MARVGRHRKFWKSEDRSKHGEPLPDAEKALREQRLLEADEKFRQAMAQAKRKPATVKS